MQQLIVMLALLGVLTGSGYYYYTDTQAKIKQYSEDNIKLQIAYQEAIESANQCKSNFDSAIAQLDSLNGRLQDSEEYSNELLRKLRRHDLTRLTYEKPGLIEQRVNDATEKLFEELESDSNSN